jgi:succinoglycan biosynthesis transport protein ExoP
LEMARQRLKEEGTSSLPLSPEIASSPLVLELMQLKKDLAALGREYKESYPDIIMLKRQIMELEDQLSVSSEKETASSPQAIPKERAVGTMIERDYIADLQKQIQHTRLEIKGLEEREKGLQHQIRIHERRVENVPAREQELATLLRDYENTRKNYASLLDKKLNAKIAGNLEKRQKGEQFRIVDSANLPEKPFAPDPVRINLVGMALGLGAGIGLVLMRQRLDSTLSKPEEIEKVTSVAVLASIPDYTEEMEHFEKMRQSILTQTERSDG